MFVQQILMENEQIVCCLDSTAELGIQIYGQHDQGCYSEQLSLDNFLKRIKELNKRVQFPPEAVRQSLKEKEPIVAILKDVEGSGGKVLELKYSLEGTMVPLKWEWKLQPIETEEFYRFVAKQATNQAVQMGQLVNQMLQMLVKKDLEIKQYSIEGFQLRRTTVITEPFDEGSFKLEHKKCLNQALSFELLSELCDANEGMVSAQFSPSLDHKFRPSTPTSGPTTSAQAGKRLQNSTPRSRKRLALAKSTNHLEKKILQRKQNPEILYKDSQSQEEDVDDWLEPNQREMKMEPEDDLFPKLMASQANKNTK